MSENIFKVLVDGIDVSGYIDRDSLDEITLATTRDGIWDWMSDNVNFSLDKSVLLLFNNNIDNIINEYTTEKLYKKNAEVYYYENLIFAGIVGEINYDFKTEELNITLYSFGKCITDIECNESFQSDSLSGDYITTHPLGDNLLRIRNKISIIANKYLSANRYPFNIIDNNYSVQGYPVEYYSSVGTRLLNFSPLASVYSIVRPTAVTNEIMYPNGEGNLDSRFLLEYNSFLKRWNLYTMHSSDTVNRVNSFTDMEFTRLQNDHTSDYDNFFILSDDFRLGQTGGDDDLVEIMKMSLINKRIQGETVSINIPSFYTNNDTTIEFEIPSHDYEPEIRMNGNAIIDNDDFMGFYWCIINNKICIAFRIRPEWVPFNKFIYKYENFKLGDILSDFAKISNSFIWIGHDKIIYIMNDKTVTPTSIKNPISCNVTLLNQTNNNFIWPSEILALDSVKRKVSAYLNLYIKGMFLKYKSIIDRNEYLEASDYPLQLKRLKLNIKGKEVDAGIITHITYKENFIELESMRRL